MASMINLKETMFDHPSKLHGRSHTLRVAYWVQVLGRQEPQWPRGAAIDPDDRPSPETWDAAVDLAFRGAIIHDTARRHDGACSEHGARAALNKRWILEVLGFDPPEADWKILAEAVRQHSLTDTELMPCLQDLCTAILKDADALDRVRLGEIPDRKYLRFPFTQTFIEQADWIFLHSEACTNWYELLELADSYKR